MLPSFVFVKTRKTLKYNNNSSNKCYCFAMKKEMGKKNSIARSLFLFFFYGKGRLEKNVLTKYQFVYIGQLLILNIIDFRP